MTHHYSTFILSSRFSRLYMILAIMTLVMFAINILQICLLDQLSNKYWLVFFPLGTLLAFLVWIGYVVFDLYKEPIWPKNWTPRHHFKSALKLFKGLFVYQEADQQPAECKSNNNFEKGVFQ